MLKENDIKEYLNRNELAYSENASVWAVVMPSKITYFIGSATLTALSLQYNVVHFNNDGVAVIGVNNITGKLEPSFIFVPNSDITEIKFKKKLLSYELLIATTRGNLSYKVNKTMVGAPWHKANLPGILSKFA